MLYEEFVLKLFIVLKTQSVQDGLNNWLKKTTVLKGVLKLLQCGAESSYLLSRDWGCLLERRVVLSVSLDNLAHFTLHD